MAEIPIISSDPTELQGLQVQLASPETFRRVGLEPPQGVASSLRFEPALDAGGRPVIRVTSAAPVQQPLLTFLLEVDWGQGRLVREYSALLDAPRTVAAPIQAPIQAPVVAPSNAIVRPPMPVAAAPQPTPPAQAPVRSAPQRLAGTGAGQRSRHRTDSAQPTSQPPSNRIRARARGPDAWARSPRAWMARRATAWRRRCSRCCAPIPMPSSAATSTSSSAARCCVSRRATNSRAWTSAMRPRWCTNRSRNGANPADHWRSLRPSRRVPRLRR